MSDLYTISAVQCDGPLGGRLDLHVKAAHAKLPAAQAAMKAMWLKRLPHFTLPARRDDLKIAGELAGHLSDGAKDVLIFGIGGSSLGGQALAQLVGWGTPSYAPQTGRPAVHFVENLDGATLDGLLARLDLGATKVLAISKSGGTSETLSQTMIALAAFERGGLRDRMATHMAVIAEPGQNPLRRLAEAVGCPVADHDPALGGRYSVLSLVGLTPALIMGLDAVAIRDGAQQALLALDDLDAPFAQGAALNVAAANAGLAATVVWGYADRLERFAMWWRQLWGESLGKGGQGLTPVRALGPVDQHSQLQLYLDGPADKLFTVMTVGAAAGAKVPASWAKKIGQDMLADRAPGEIVAAQARATTQTLAQNGRPVRAIHVPRLDERAMGALMMHFMLETLMAAELMGVDPFDQPAVEQGKILTRKFLMEPGA